VTSLSRLPLLSVASGTLISRASGLLRVLVLAYVLGFTPLADAFNLANTVPNMLFDLVLGGVASATFIPVFIERLALDGERRAWRSISSVLSFSLVVLLLASALARLLAPFIIGSFTVWTHASGAGGAQVLAQRDVAVSFLRWFIPQIFFYGVIGLMGTLLNIRQKFGAVAWAPITNNIVCCLVLFWFHLVDPSPTLASLHGDGHLAWLGVGTTLGVAIQATVLIPSLSRSSLHRLRFRWNLRDPALATIARLGSWTVLVILANQISLFVVLACAFTIGGQGPISAYTYGWSFMQMPYAVVVVSVLNVLTPRLAEHAARGERLEFRERLGAGVRESLAIIIPLSFLLVVLAQPVVALFLHHGDASHRLAAGTVLAILVAGLPGFTIFQVCVRGLQTLQRARDVFWLYLGQNILTVAGILLIGRHSLGGLVASIALAYSLAAGGALLVLHEQGVTLWEDVFSWAVGRTVASSLGAAFASALAYSLFTSVSGFGLLLRTGFSVLFGAGSFFALTYWRKQRATPAAQKV